jgi:hypothetical protein
LFFIQLNHPARPFFWGGASMSVACNDWIIREKIAGYKNKNQAIIA